MNNNKTLALFDFDGTITYKDTLFQFVQFTHGKLKFFLGLWVLSPVLVLHLIGFIRNDVAKRILFKFFFGKWEYEKFKNAGAEFCAHHLPLMLRKPALDKINEHINNGDR